MQSYDKLKDFDIDSLVIQKKWMENSRCVIELTEINPYAISWCHVEMILNEETWGS